MAAKSKIGILAAVLLMCVLAIPAYAGGGGGGGGGGRGGRGRGGAGGPGGGPGGVGGPGGGPGGAVAPGGGPGGGPGFGGRGGGNNQATQLANIQTTVGFSADEMAALQSKLVAVLNDIAVVQSGEGSMFGNARGGGRGGRGAGGPGGAAAVGGMGAAAAGATQNDVQKALADLQAVLAQADATPDSIKAKLDAFRDAMNKAQETLLKDRNDLKSALTQKQEAEMVTLGVLN